MMRHSSSERPPCLLSTSSGTRDLPTSWNSAAMPRSYSCSLVRPSLRPRATEKMQTFTECECVFVVVAQRGEPHERRLVVQHLVDDCLHGALDLLHVGRAPQPDAVDDLLRHRD